MLSDKELKPETDPGWEARQVEKRAKRKRNQAFDDKPEASSESSPSVKIPRRARRSLSRAQRQNCWLVRMRSPFRGAQA